MFNIFNQSYLFCLICTTCRSPEGKRGLDEVWNEEDDEVSAKEGRKRKLKEERVTGLQSGFDRLNLAGYREAVLGEFDRAEELGRQEGFRQGFVANPEANPTLALACMEGQLMALSNRSSQGGVQTQVSCCYFVLSNIFLLFSSIPPLFYTLTFSL